MKTEQIIYTSCRQGIEGQSSGYQVYSYSPGMRQWIANRNAIGVLEQYKAPVGDQYPPLPTPEQIEECYPKRDYSGPLSGPDALYGMALSTYIGRDYPEGSIRGGNFIAHAVALPLATMMQTGTYPCEYLESPSFQRTMDITKARSDERPAMLGTLDIEPNDEITFDAVQDFLMDDDRDEMLKLMLACFLNREQGGALRRIIIRDSAENFNLWVAALQMALPLRQAYTYSFSTYEYDPMAADAHIMRGVDGMNGSLPQLAMSNYVFDERGEVPLPNPMVDETVRQLCDFLVDAMQTVPDSLHRFHDFLNATDHTTADIVIADAYTLFQLVQGLTAFDELDTSAAERALVFMRDHCGGDVLRKVSDRLFDECRTTVFPEDKRTLLADVFGYATRSDKTYALTARERALDLLFGVFTNAAPSQDMYAQSHALADTVLAQLGEKVDVVLFDELTGNPDVNLGLSGGTGTSLPWTVHAYAQWTSQAVLDAVAKGIDLRPGMSAAQMKAALGTRNATALDKIIKVVVHHPDGNGTRRLVTDFAGSLSADPRLGCMVDLLIILEGDPTGAGAMGGSAASGLPSSVTMAYTAFHTLYMSSDGEGSRTRIGYLQSCYASGLQSLVVSLLAEQARTSHDPGAFLAFLKTTGPYLPKDFWQDHARDVVAVCERTIGNTPSAALLCVCAQTVRSMVPMPLTWYRTKIDQASAMLPILRVDNRVYDDYRAIVALCKDVSLPLPARLTLIDYQFHITNLANAYAQRNPDPMVIDGLCNALMQTGPRLPLSAAGNQVNAFVASVGDAITPVVLTSKSGATLQLKAVPSTYDMTVMKQVAGNVVSSKRIDDILLLMALDSCCFGASADQLHQNAMAIDLARFLTSQLTGMHMKSSELTKYVEDERKFDKHVAVRFSQTYGTAFPKGHFTALFGMIIDGLAAYEAANPSVIDKMKKFLPFGRH
ncbi:hypothetical protein BTIS_0237 [Bifidobacterium tissieri]|uniref:Uncharacterized protein n=1 Tax=Bifidobacterium tissieri TaxID=1630162 RepID=A0A261FIU0_9BIFI|nr:hypothetical protein [Bifidobacterium tissieri]OZG59084.1 hypothetical protein BTIS_0237 [Bifidobacterium tissieri]